MYSIYSVNSMICTLWPFGHVRRGTVLFTGHSTNLCLPMKCTPCSIRTLSSVDSVYFVTLCTLCALCTLGALCSLLLDSLFADCLLCFVDCPAMGLLNRVYSIGVHECA